MLYLGYLNLKVGHRYSSNSPVITKLQFVSLPVVFPWIHLSVFNSVFFGKKHEGIHWSFALVWRSGTHSTCSPWAVAFASFAVQRIGGKMWRCSRGTVFTTAFWSLGILIVWSPTGQRSATLASHAAEHIHCRGVHRGKIITTRKRQIIKPSSNCHVKSLNICSLFNCTTFLVFCSLLCDIMICAWCGCQREKQKTTTRLWQVS